MSKGLSTISNEERWNRTARKEARAIYAWHKNNIGINKSDKFVNVILTNDRNKKVRYRHQTLTGLFFFHRLIADFTPHKITARHSGTVDIFGVTVLALIEITLIGL